MSSNTSNSYVNDYTKHCSIHPILTFLVPKPKLSNMEKFDHDYDETFLDKDYCLNVRDERCSIFSQWWNARYQCQRSIIHAVEQPLYQTIIIILVLMDCVLVKAELLLDFLKLHESCRSKTIPHSTVHEKHLRMELAIEILHYISLAVLTMFVIEVFVKTYAFGRYWWNFSEKKMDWVDAMIVILSFVVGLITLYQNNVFAKITLLVIFLRLWRSIRIIHSIVRTILFQHEKNKKDLFTSYHELIEIFFTLSEKKTAILSELSRDVSQLDIASVVEKFEVIDQSCRATVEQCTHSLSLSAVKERTRDLQDALETVEPMSITVDPSSSEDVKH